MTNKEILDLEFECSNLNREITIRDLFKWILSILFEDGNFSITRRPFGGGKWYYDLCGCLAQNGILNGDCSDNCGFTVWDYDSKEAERKILELIKEL